MNDNDSIFFEFYTEVIEYLEYIENRLIDGEHMTGAGEQLRDDILRALHGAKGNCSFVEEAVWCNHSAFEMSVHNIEAWVKDVPGDVFPEHVHRILHYFDGLKSLLEAVDVQEAISIVKGGSYISPEDTDLDAKDEGRLQLPGGAKEHLVRFAGQHLFQVIDRLSAGQVGPQTITETIDELDGVIAMLVGAHVPVTVFQYLRDEMNTIFERSPATCHECMCHRLDSAWSFVYALLRRRRIGVFNSDVLIHYFDKVLYGHNAPCRG